jgi:hypothetical protein
MTKFINPDRDSDTFARIMAEVWDGDPDLEQNACEAAREIGARRISAIPDASWRKEPGDDPASLWRFPDQSVLAISDDGSWLMQYLH